MVIGVVNGWTICDTDIPSILVALLMIMSVYLPHGGYAEERSVAVLEDIRRIVEEARALGGKDFFIGGDTNIELKLDSDVQDFAGWDSVDWYGLGPACRRRRG